MKFWMFTFVFSLSVFAQARTVGFLCTAADQSTVNRFTGSGLVEITGNKAEGSFSGSLIQAGRNPVPKETGELSAKGDAQIIPPGKFAVNEVIVLKLSSGPDDKKTHLMCNLGLNGDWSSTLIADGFSYRAKCSEYK